MKKITMVLVVIGVLAFGVSTALCMHHAVKIQNKDGIGKYFTDTEGNALYWFKKDSPGKSSCMGPCLEKWPVYYRETVAAPKNIDAKEFGTITREDGKKQTTFRGYPLYYWINDKQPGDTNGQGTFNIWFVVNPDNFPPK
jgi:predicted lipoprotein with Yx(FWY)xxD motif